MSCEHKNQVTLFAKGGTLFVCKDCLANVSFKDTSHIAKKLSKPVDLEPENRMTPKDLCELAVASGKLNDWEKTFVTDLLARADKYQGNLILSEKQQSILDKIQVNALGITTAPAASFDASKDIPFMRHDDF